MCAWYIWMLRCVYVRACILFCRRFALRSKLSYFCFISFLFHSKSIKPIIYVVLSLLELLLKWTDFHWILNNFRQFIQSLLRNFYCIKCNLKVHQSFFWKNLVVKSILFNVNSEHGVNFEKLNTLNFAVFYPPTLLFQ